MVKTTQVSAQTTDIPGLLIFDVSAMRDDRGYYQETFQKQKLVEVGMPDDFDVVQINTSYNKQAGVTRGFHAEPWNKYITVLTGRAFGAYVDLRQGDSFGKTVTVELKPETAVYLPKGVGNSFQALDDDMYYVYAVDEHWKPELYDEYCFANLADPEIGIDWPISLERATLSERDKNHPVLSNVKRFKL